MLSVPGKAAERYHLFLEFLSMAATLGFYGHGQLQCIPKKS